MTKTSSHETPHTTAAACDIFIIGGGINGCGIARELASRGYKVQLAEMRDLSSGTSSWSTKLIHGGLRYLEYYEFGLVRKALQEREILMNMAPHLIHPLRFVLPHLPNMRSKWLLRAGLFLYDYLGPRKILPASKAVNLKTDIAGDVLAAHLTSGFEYSDCMVDDNRLTIANARAAAQFGAHIMPRTKVIAARQTDNGWQVETSAGTIAAKMVINAGGPWADSVRTLKDNKTASASHNKPAIRLVRGSHIITAKLFDHDKAYIFQNSDGRILFAIPYLNDFTLLGTTDVDHHESPDDPIISQDEIDYICREVSAYLKQDITSDDVLFTYSGVRPLYDDGAADAKATTRDYVLAFEDDTDNSWLNIFGGKLTTYRQLALQVADKIADSIPAPSQTLVGTTPLPGGDMAEGDFARFHARLASTHSHIEPTRLRRMALAYGTDIFTILGPAGQPCDDGIDFGCGLYQCEVDFLVEQEWAQTADDILMRRTKLGYHADDEMRQKLTSYLATK